MDDRFEHTPLDFVHVLSATYIYIGVKDRAQFDLIDRPVRDRGENDSGHCLTKTVKQGDVNVVFQYWIKSLTSTAFLEKRARERAAKASAA